MEEGDYLQIIDEKDILIRCLLNTIQDLAGTNQMLTNALLGKTIETDIKIKIPEPQGFIGKERWHDMKARLEKEHRKLSNITEPVEEEKENAS